MKLTSSFAPICYRDMPTADSNSWSGKVEGVAIYVKDRFGDRQPIDVITVADIENIEEEITSVQQISWFDGILNFFKSLFD